MAPVAEEVLRKRVDEWKQRLIDLTRKNHLLCYRRTKSSTLEISEPGTEEIFRTVCLEGGCFEFWMPPEEEATEPSTDLPDEAEIPAEFDDTFPLEEDKEGKLVCGRLDRKTISNNLKNLYRKEREEYRERGIRVLFLAFGMLEWMEAGSDEHILSPLLLFPVELKRESAHDPFVLHPVEEDLVLNPALQVKMKRDFNWELPPIPEDWDEMSVSGYLDSVRNQAEEWDWSVQDSVVLRIFTFEKLGMYQDLDKNFGTLSGHACVRALCGEAFPAADLSEIKDPRKLDAIQKPEDTFQILDADSSQQQAIQAVLKGQSIVLQGPPGTGKSQTIANIISESIARGKTVLFASEKMAALEVVAKRLNEAKLGTYCLELHSRKKNKKEVVEELYSCMERRLVPQKTLTPEDYANFTAYRTKLNYYVNALHEFRPAIGCSARQALSMSADGVKEIRLEAARLDELSPARLQSLEDMVRALVPVWQVAEEGEGFPWLGCLTGRYDSGVEQEWLIRLQKTTQAIERLGKLREAVVSKTGLPAGDTLTEAEWLWKVLRHVEGRPNPDPSWVTASGLEDVLEEAKGYGSLAEKYWQARNDLGFRYTAPFFELTPEVLPEIEEAWTAAARVLSHDPDGSKLIRAYRDVIECLKKMSGLLSEVESDCSLMARAFGCEKAPFTLDSVARLVRLGTLCASAHKPEASWLSQKAVQDVLGFIEDNRAVYEDFRNQKTELLKRYEESFLELDHTEMAVRFNSFFYKTPLCFLNTGWHRSRKELIMHTRDLACPKNILADLNTARSVARHRRKIEGQSSEAASMLGAYYKGENTDFDTASHAARVAEETVHIAGGDVPACLAASMSSGGKLPAEIAAAVDRTASNVREIFTLATTLGTVADLAAMPPLNKAFNTWNITELAEWSGNLLTTLRRLAGNLDTVLETCAGWTPQSLRKLLDDLELKLAAENIAAAIDRESERLGKLFGSRFQGLATTWKDVMAAIEWTLEFRRLCDGRSVSRRSVEFLSSGEDSPFTSEELGVALARATEAAKEVEAGFAAGRPALRGARLIECGLEEISRHIGVMAERVKDLEHWADYKRAFDRLSTDGPSGYAARLAADPPPAKDLTRVLRKSVAQARVRLLMEEDPWLREFRGANHEQLIAEFRDADRRLIELAPAAVMERCNELRPTVNGFEVQGSETALLRREAKKSRRHMPLVRLFEKIPNLLLKLKPCLMMSPLSVSQYINPERFSFDLVIFDEASQIFTEDAIVAIYRGKQVVVAGDSKQMPPTNFFKALDDGLDEDDEDDDTLSSADFSSVLDECDTILPSFPLRWHYRSRHESLIAYSNEAFYRYLVTFPSSLAKHDDFGVQFAHVKDGVYDRGGRRANLREAEVVTGKVFEHFRTRPGKSLGVVAFSQQQADAIEDEIERRRRDDSGFEQFFNEDRLEGFFVKNLENVQGDERDVMIFSVGYGYDQHGRFPMSFGPLNKTGGERRLNVAITRAREKVLVVSSVRAADFTLPAEPKPGVLHLYRYLDYAERGAATLETTHPAGQGEIESPLEEEIASAISQLGYRFVPQVGCSGYRIDLGVLHPQEPGRFILGVECDGASYHSGATARDRDRLRQQVLERLGWKIHRIWSQDWFHHRERQVVQLKDALESAVIAPGAVPRADAAKPAVRKLVVKEVVVPEKQDIDVRQLKGVKAYKARRVTVSKNGYEFHAPENRNSLAWLLKQVVETEGPVHIDIVARRLANAYGLAKVGPRMLQAVKSAANLAALQKWAVKRNSFLWCPENMSVVPRIPSDTPESFRDIEYVAPEEIQAAMELIIRQCVGISSDALFSETARLFGTLRVTTRIRNHLETIAAQMEKKGIAKLNGDSITLSKS